MADHPTLLLLDLDGVLRRFDPDDQVEDAHGLPRGSLAASAFHPEVVRPALLGEVDDAGWQEAIAGRLVGQGVAPEVARSAAGAWRRTGSVVPEAVELVRLARRRCRVALLTNATTRLGADLRALGLDREVDAVVSSHRLGAVKPDPEAFRRALRVLQHSPARTLFCDDSAANTAAAAELGLMAAHVPDTGALRAALVEHGLLDAGDGPGGGRDAAAPGVLVVLPDRDEAEELAEELTADGWSPCSVHRDMLAGEDDAEDVDWVVLVETAPDGLPASCWRDALDRAAEQRDGFTTEAG
ncbi:HAD family hydrolase [Streptoalloteichus hindustanus]|uniref:Haloacid dehalogenase superfamily, subfamily IA, variant 3 with third motif having DD or ED n=1 Tax=Streptoalloteichus hindustanus TaxID=2017 RepID=A0A1M5K7F1_STRHI|nr:HAD family hydrolase [Streptoalloteichus hindustanus]SHG48752.1 haloacid dehalogenase superfamily, subfamily IA, variant 3 with third motif having DD or ED [Streptoalloteichus hindustanus]